MTSNIIFILVLLGGIFLFYKQIHQISKNIKIGTKSGKYSNIVERLKNVLFVAIGQSKMYKQPVAGVLHIFIYFGFILVNIELLEIVYDGITGSHRVFGQLSFYPFFISFIEILALLVIIACFVFLYRRNILKINRFHTVEMTKWPRMDANIILIFEIVLMFAFLMMNAADLQLQRLYISDYQYTGDFLISGLLSSLISGISTSNLIILERFCWWFHIIGIIGFLNYIPSSKHFHIILAFPNVYFSKLQPLAFLSNMESVTKEVKIAMGIVNENVYPADNVQVFGAKDVVHLSRKSLMDAYSCTECGRCTMVCPAYLTGKKLSPRKIIMDTRDRLEEFGKSLNKKIDNSEIRKVLLRDYISEEEIWACTTCNACAYECPVNIDPVKIIIDLRRYLFMEEGSVPSALNLMSSNLENNGAPWQYPAANRDNWTKDLYLNQ